MLIHPWDAAVDDTEWQNWLATHDFGQLAVNGLPGKPPIVQPLHFAYDVERSEAVTHLARPNPIWRALETDPRDLPGTCPGLVFRGFAARLRRREAAEQ